MSIVRLASSLIPLVLFACTEDVAPEMANVNSSTGGAAPESIGETNLGGAFITTGGTTTATGGSNGTAVSSGGTQSGGGPMATGGSGGVTTGGFATGGALFGGSPSGGTSAGGAPSGGTSTGGAAFGGTSATGGAATGGTASGGVSTGGTSAGGTATGGTESVSAGGSTESAGAGGEANSPTPIVLPHGYAPVTATWNDAVLAYNEWKAVHLQDCGGGVYRVPWENAKLDATVSEGIGYGMLLSVAHDDRVAFDGLLAYYNQALDAWGLMHWLRYDCDAHYDTKYNEYPDNAAADADLDVAMALAMADCKWGGSYRDEAIRLINAIEASTIGWDGSVSLLQPGDSEFFENNGCLNYSYFAPGYYRAFAQLVPERADFWNQLANDTYELLARASDGTTGLVRNWGASGGGSASGCSFDGSDDYGTDASRTPWRVGVDYLWWGTPDAKAWLDRLTNWVLSQPVAELGLWYQLDGTLDSNHRDNDAHTAITLGPWAVGAMAHSQDAVDTLTAELLAIPTGAGSFDAEYFPRSLRALSLLALTGRFTMCGGAAHMED